MSTLTVKKNGFKFQVLASRHEAMWSLLQEGYWEPESLDILDRYIRKGETFLDLGAWIGPLSLYAALKGAEVYSVEPDPIAFQELKQNASLNPPLRIHPIPVALDLENGRRELFISSFPGCSGSSIAHTGSGEHVTISTMTIDRLIQKFSIPKIDFLKMDVEGAEFFLLPALQEFLQKNRPTLYLSLHAPLIKTFHSSQMESVIQSIDFYQYFYTPFGQPFDIQTLLDPFWSQECRAFVATDTPWIEN